MIIACYQKKCGKEIDAFLVVVVNIILSIIIVSLAAPPMPLMAGWRGAWVQQKTHGWDGVSFLYNVMNKIQ